jgi:hypothetical protein
MQMLVMTNEASLYWNGDQRLLFMLGLLNPRTESMAWQTSLTMLQVFYNPKCM